ncbi:MAG TPA: hypothetical protein VL362_00470 [Patescibacteria group bacterium]|nr:hypothetical protein [Patescibacteria group bacterium]
MADKRSVKRNIKKIQHVKSWQIFVVFLLSLFVSATFLRLNNVGMIERRDGVYHADKVGDEYLIAERLYDLQRYSSEHMNASSGDVYLDKAYTRDVEKRTKAAQAANAASSKKSAEILRQAYETCKNRFPGYSLSYTLCVGAEQDKIPANSIGVTKVDFPPAALYKHSFISPLWSPDYAGWSVLVSLLLGVAVIVRMLIGAYLRWQLHRRYRSA